MTKHKLFGLILLFMFVLLACSTADLPSRDQLEAGAATAQAAAQQASAYATQVAPTLQALATQTSGTAADARATLTAAGIDRDYLIAKARSLAPDAEGNINLVLTETELNLLLNARLLFANNNEEETPLQGITARLTGGAILLSGQLTTPVQGQLAMLMQPYVADGEIHLTIVSATLDGQPVPQAVLDRAQSSLDSALNSGTVGLPAGYNVTAIVVNEGSLTITARK